MFELRNYLGEWEMYALNDLVEMGITKRQDMIDFINSCEINENSKAFERSIKRSDERLLEALNSWSDEEIKRIVQACPLTLEEVIDFPYQVKLKYYIF